MDETRRELNCVEESLNPYNNFLAGLDDHRQENYQGAAVGLGCQDEESSAVGA